MERFIAIDNICAWPNLKLLANGELIVFVFNKPGHGTFEGDIECWASGDGGRLWGLRSAVTEHEPDTNRMNLAAGLSPSGAVLAVVSGWANPTKPPAERYVIPTWVCRSEDNGATWTREEAFPVPEGEKAVIPFGDVLALPDGRLAVTAYSWNPPANSSWIYFSEDDGCTWGNPSLIGGAVFNETVVLLLENGEMIAAARTMISHGQNPDADQHLKLFISDNLGESWRQDGPLTLNGQIPGALTRLRDGRLLLTYGVRCYGLYGVAARFGSPDAAAWSRPFYLVNCKGAGDGGYPSSVQLNDGTIVTAYYANKDRNHQRYHMGVIRWTVEEVGS
jgi:hypothetical protein